MLLWGSYKPDLIPGEALIPCDSFRLYGYSNRRIFCVILLWILNGDLLLSGKPAFDSAPVLKTSRRVIEPLSIRVL